jgi:rhodanese-related sulfurtransferase
MGIFSRFGLPKVSASEAIDLSSGAGMLLDIRENDEFNAGHAPGAVHIPLGALDAKLPRVPDDRPVVVVCRSGMRARSATKLLLANGRDARLLQGGMHAWQHAGGRMVDRKGRPGRVV